MKASIRETLEGSGKLERQGNLFCRSGSDGPASFEKAYIALRETERRLYSDETVRRLPDNPPDHPHSAEWAVRKRSMTLLIRYLSRMDSVKTILEVGCGNGWLSNSLARDLKAEVCAVDVNRTELQQAARVFTDPGLSFVYASVWEEYLPRNAFDAIVLAGSVQYFPVLKSLLTRLFEFLTRRGEIHILDSPIYPSTADADMARNRSRDYFGSIGSPQMALHYFHHTFADLAAFDTYLLHDPTSVASRIRNKILRTSASPFPWIRIQRR